MQVWQVNKAIPLACKVKITLMLPPTGPDVCSLHPSASKIAWVSFRIPPLQSYSLVELRGLLSAIPLACKVKITLMLPPTGPDVCSTTPICKQDCMGFDSHPFPPKLFSGGATGIALSDPSCVQGQNNFDAVPCGARCLLHYTHLQASLHGFRFASLPSKVILWWSYGDSNPGPLDCQSSTLAN